MGKLSIIENFNVYLWIIGKAESGVNSKHVSDHFGIALNKSQRMISDLEEELYLVLDHREGNRLVFTATDKALNILKNI